jgi:type II secretion system protein N
VRERVLKYVEKYASVVGYPLFFFVCLLLFFSVTFPYEKLKERIIYSYNAEQRPGGSQQELQIDELGGYWVSGVKMKGVRLLSAPTEPGKPPSRIEIDEASVRYALLPLLVGSSDIGFDVQAFGGEASGSYDEGGKEKSVDVTLDAIDIGKIDPLVQLLGVPLEGKLSGRVRLTMPEGKASKGSGSVSLEANDVFVGDGKAKIKGALALPKITVGTITLVAEAKDGTMRITKLLAGGKDVDLQGEGRITMRELATDSLCDAQIRFKINDAYRGKNDITKSLFGVPGSSAPALFELADPKIKQAKRADGYFGFSMRGPLGNPEFFPNPNGPAFSAPK